MTLFCSAPMTGDIRRLGGASSAETDVLLVQHTLTGANPVSVNAALAASGVPGSIDFGGGPNGVQSCLFRTGAWSAANGTNGTRAEFVLPYMPVPAAPAHVRYRTRAEFWLGDEWADQSEASILQLHCGSGGFFPALILMAGGGRLSTATPSAWDSDAAHRRLLSAPLPMGRWFTVDVVMWMAKGEMGLMSLWIDGARVGSIEPLRTSYTDTTNGPYGKIGIYNIYRNQVSYSMYCRGFEMHSGPESDGSWGANASRAKAAATINGWR